MGPVRVLLIEDEADLRESLCESLECAGYEVLPAQDGDEGLSLYFRQKPDVVVTDILMPIKDGLEVIMELRRNVPDAKVIAMAAAPRQGSTLDLLNLARKLGACGAVAKPFDPSKLAETIETCLGSAAPSAG
jgi:CheY-like chemotaxis protein